MGSTRLLLLMAMGLAAAPLLLVAVVASGGADMVGCFAGRVVTGLPRTTLRLGELRLRLSRVLVWSAAAPLLLMAVVARGGTDMVLILPRCMLTLLPCTALRLLKRCLCLSKSVYRTAKHGYHSN